MEASEEAVDTRFIVCVEDISNVWALLKPSLDTRPPWRGMHLRNKVGISVTVPELQVQYMLANAPRLLRLRQRMHSPVTWFRNPFVQLILISGDDPDEYKRTLKGQLKRVLEAEKEVVGGAPEFVIAFIQAAGSEPTSNFLKSSRKVFSSIRGDIGTRKQDRVVRLDLNQQGSVSHTSVVELERQLADAFRTTFAARQAAYDDEIRKLTAGRQLPNWEFSTLFLVKDSLAAMLESASLLEDALREYTELEALFLTTLRPLQGSQNTSPFGGTSPGDDVAQLVRATWRDTRSAYKRHGLLQFEFQQFLFSCQARILLKLGRPAEVAERGLGLVQSLSEAMLRETEAGRLPPLFREAWVFSACISLAETTVRIGPPPPTPKPQTPMTNRQTSLPPLPLGIHRRATSEMGQDTAQMPQRWPHHNRSMSANEAATDTEGSTGDDSQAENSDRGDEFEDDDKVSSRPLNHDSRDASIESATVHQRRRLKPVRVTHNNRSGLEVEGGLQNGKANAKQSSKGRSIGGNDEKPPPRGPQISWQLGVAGTLQEDFLEEATPSAWQTVEGGDRLRGESAGASQRHFWCLLGHLYARARAALGSMDGHFDMPISVASSPQSAKGIIPNGVPPLLAEDSRQHSVGHILYKSSAEANHNLEPPAQGTQQHRDLAADESAVSTPQFEVQKSAFEKVSGSKFVNHARKLSRFGMEATPHQRSESFNNLAHHHSRRSSVSEISNSAFSEADSIGSLIRRPSDSDFQRPEADLRNVQIVEREVETASEDSGSPNSILKAGKFEGSHSSLPWLTEWRLRLALTSPSRYQELWLELSGAAACCYTAAGWRRTGEVMVCKIAEMLIQRGQAVSAAAIMQRQARQLLGEGWLQLSGHTLKNLLDCHTLLYQVASASVCMQLLSLSANSASKGRDMSHVQEAMMNAAQVPSSKRPQFSGIEASSASLGGLDAIMVQPVEGHFSRFFGQSEVNGTPITAPSRLSSSLLVKRDSDSVGATHACVGDVLRIPVLINSRLPQKLALSQLRLALNVLQEVSIVISPRGGGSGHDVPLTRGQGHLRTHSMRSTDSPMASFAAPRHSSTIPESGTPGTSVSNQETQHKTGTRWQDTDEISGTFLGIGPAASTSESDQYEIDPGQTLLWFEVVALKRGLYCLKHIIAMMGTVKLKMKPFLPNITSINPKPSYPLPTPSSLGMCDATGKVSEEIVLLHVDSAMQRVGTSAVLPRGHLISGLQQWIGISVVSRHDSVTDASLVLRALGALESAPTGSGSVPLSLETEPAWIQPINSTSGLPPEEKDFLAQERDGQPSESGVASTSGRESEPWSMDQQGYGALPAWVAQKPCLLWLWATAGEVKVHHDVVRVTPLMSHISLRALVAGTDLPSPVKSPSRAATEIVGGPRGAVELDVNVNYVAGCQRGHISRLSLPVLPPFRLHITGKELPEQRVALQISLTSSFSSPTLVTAIHLDPQPGFTCQPQPPELDSLLPLRIDSQGSAALLLFLTVATQHASLDRKRIGRIRSSLQLEFKHCAAAFPSNALQEVGSDWSTPLLGSLALHSPPARASEKKGVLNYSFVLDLGAASTAPRSTVYIRLLGPFSARAGEVVTFCWRLQRSRGFAAEQENELLLYEIRAEGEGWRPWGTRCGSVRLPLEASSAATVEATWTPAKSGMLPMPQLMLPDIPHQEVFDVGDSNHVINVT